MVLRVINSEIKIIPMSLLIHNIKNIFSKYKKDNISMVDDFLRMKREDTELEK